MDRRLIDRRLRKLEADLPDPVPEPAASHEGLRQIAARFKSGEASYHDFRVWFDADGERFRTRLLEHARRWDETRHDPTALRLFDHKLTWARRLALEIITTPLDQPTPADERHTLLFCARRSGTNDRCMFGHDWWQAVLLLMAMGGPDGLPLRREFASRRDQGQDGS